MQLFLQNYGIEILLILYGIINTFFNVILFRRTGKISRSSADVITDTGTTDKLTARINKARSKLEKLIDKAVLNSEDKSNGSSE